MISQTETIAAVATPLGEGGISVIRISGPDAIEILARCVDAAHDPRTVKSHTVHFAAIKDAQGDNLDQVLYSVFVGPRSYTGEDVVEISCHGGMLVTRRVLEAILSSGARHADPGEFTKRAFLNGKLDLAQAEAVAELIHASSDKAHRTSLSHLDGDYSQRIASIRTSLIEAMGLLELELDFAEDGYELVDKSKVESQVRSAQTEINSLLKSYMAGRAIREGVSVVIVGAPNAGKSSLMNRLLKESRAIVAEIPGTTRDVISESIMIQGVLFRLSDTAGIRAPKDTVEEEGVRRSKKKLSTADVILLVLDSTRSLEGQLEEIGEEALGIINQKGEFVQIALNKVDIADELPKIPESLRRMVNSGYSRISAKTGEGILGLEEGLLGHVPGFGRSGSPEGEIVTTARHYGVFLRVSDSLEQALISLSEGQTGEFVASDLRIAMDGLGEVTGDITNENIINDVFSRFCIGK